MLVDLPHEDAYGCPRSKSLLCYLVTFTNIIYCTIVFSSFISRYCFRYHGSFISLALFAVGLSGLPPCPSACLPVCLSVCRSTCLSLSLSLSLSVCLPVCLFAVCLPTCLSFSIPALLSFWYLFAFQSVQVFSVLSH